MRHSSPLFSALACLSGCALFSLVACVKAPDPNLAMGTQSQTQHEGESDHDHAQHAATGEAQAGPSNASAPSDKPGLTFPAPAGWKAIEFNSGYYLGKWATPNGGAVNMSYTGPELSKIEMTFDYYLNSFQVQGEINRAKLEGGLLPVHTMVAHGQFGGEAEATLAVAAVVTHLGPIFVKWVGASSAIDGQLEDFWNAMRQANAGSSATPAPSKNQASKPKAAPARGAPSLHLKGFSNWESIDFNPAYYLGKWQTPNGGLVTMSYTGPEKEKVEMTFNYFLSSFQVDGKIEKGEIEGSTLPVHTMMLRGRNEKVSGAQAEGWTMAVGAVMTSQGPIFVKWVAPSDVLDPQLDGFWAMLKTATE